jgi:hypothetical protein
MEQEISDGRQRSHGGTAMRTVRLQWATMKIDATTDRITAA